MHENKVQETHGLLGGSTALYQKTDIDKVPITSPSKVLIEWLTSSTKKSSNPSPSLVDYLP